MPYRYKMVTREEWGALPPTGEVEPLPSPITKVLMTKTKTPACDSDEGCRSLMRQLQKFHMDKGLEDIPYSFIVTPNNMIYEGRGWYKSVPTPPERPEFKFKAIVIGHVGDFPDYAPEQRNMFLKMFNFADFHAFSGTMLCNDYDLRCILPNWNDTEGIYEEFGVTLPHQYGDGYDSSKDTEGF